MLTTTLRLGPKDHGRAISDEELEIAEYRGGYDYEVIFGRLYVSPATNPEHDVVEKHIAPGARIRLGGLVKQGSVVRGENLQVRFDVTDGKSTVAVAYQGLLPDLFREGQGIVTEGMLERSGIFRADSVLAKHDETYMPKEVADALKKQGHWKAGDQQVGAAPQGSAP